jgi:parvulin-like peptidyl-prolyl isomerase
MSNKIIIRQDEDFRQEIKNAVFRLNLGEVSRPIKINNKFYIFRLDSVIMPRQQNLSECQDKIYTLLFEKKIQERLSKWLGELRKQAYIKISKD